MVLHVFILLVGFLFLVKGADWFVEGAAGIAKKLGIPQLVIGLTIVAMGTSMPEAAVSITAALNNNAGITIGNIVGSNILNILIILGITAVITNVAIQKSTLLYEIPFMIGITALLLVFGLTGSSITFIEGVVFLLLFIAFLVYLFIMSKKGEVQEEGEIKDIPVWKCLLFMVIGGVMVVKGSDFAVSGASWIARFFGMSERFIGLTIVAMGTSLPETAVSVTASLVNNNELAVSNVVGSNIFNLMVVVGVCSILTPILVQKETIRRDIPFSMICALLLLGLGILAAGDTIGMRLGHLDGMILLGFFAGYIVVMIQSAMKARAAGKNVDMEGMEELEEEIGILSWPKSILFIVGGALAIAFGGDLTVDAASRIAIDLGMSQTLVGLTIVSIGTSLPELVTSVVAARKNEVDMAVGNAVGSNIFNILMVLGVASAINPVALIRENIIDFVILIVFSLIVWIYAATKQRISRKEGISMVCMYLIYAGYIIWR